MLAVMSAGLFNGIFDATAVRDVVLHGVPDVRALRPFASEASHHVHGLLDGDTYPLRADGVGKVSVCSGFPYRRTLSPTAVP